MCLSLPVCDLNFVLVNVSSDWVRAVLCFWFLCLPNMYFHSSLKMKLDPQLSPSQSFWVVLECPRIATAGFVNSIQNSNEFWSSQYRQGWELLLLALFWDVLHSPSFGMHGVEITYNSWAINYQNDFYYFCWRPLWFLNS